MIRSSIEKTKNWNVIFSKVNKITYELLLEDKI